MKKEASLGIALFLLLMGLVFASSSWADSEELGPWKKFKFSAGNYFVFHDTRVRLDSKTLGRGADIDLEEQLNLDPIVQSFRFDAYWRYLPKHRLEFSFFDISREGSSRIGKNVQFGDQTFFVGVTLNTNFDVKVYKASYHWAFIHNNKYEFGASLGLNVMDMKLELANPILGSFVAEGVTIPLPVFGFKGEYFFTPKFSFVGGAEVFALKIGESKGYLLDLNLALEYAMNDWFGVGLGYTFYDINVIHEDDDIDLRVDYALNGIRVFFSIYF